MTSSGGAGVTYGAPMPLELKAQADTWEVSGYGSTWDVDLGNDRVLPGAYKKTISDGHPIRFLFSHQPDQVIGKALEVREDDRGLFFRGKISQTTLGRDVRVLLQDQAIDAFSIGFRPVDWSVDQHTQTRLLRELELYEISLVSMPMNTGAVVTGMKGRRAPRSPLVARLEAAVVRLRHHAFVAGMSDAEARGYAMLLRSRLPGPILPVRKNWGGR
jgi:HK97 family phage prohead protease